MARSSSNTHKVALLSLLLATACSAGTEGLAGHLDSADGGVTADANIADSSIIDADAGFADARELCGLTPGEVSPIDREPPRLLELTVENPNPQPGEVSYYRGRVADDLGVESLSIVGPDRFYVSTRVFDEQGAFEIEIPIDACIQSALVPTAFQINDRVGRTTFINFSPEERARLTIAPAVFLVPPKLTAFSVEPTPDGFEVRLSFDALACTNATLLLPISRVGDLGTCLHLVGNQYVVPATSSEMILPAAFRDCHRTGAWELGAALRGTATDLELDISGFETSIDFGSPEPVTTPILSRVQFEKITEPEGTIVRVSADVDPACWQYGSAYFRGIEDTDVGFDGLLYATPTGVSGCAAIPSSAPPGGYRLASLYTSSLSGCGNGFIWEDVNYREWGFEPTGSFVPSEEIVIQHP
jgi:hypothetical protein